MNKIAVVLSSHDDVCCRSNSIRNLLLLVKVSKLLYNCHLDIYIHPGEYSFLYRLFCLNLFESCKISFKKKVFSLSIYNTVYSVFSSALFDQEIVELYIYDPSLKNDYILNVFENAKLLD